MRVGELLTTGAALAVAIVHFGFQWYGWKVHLGELAPLLYGQGDQLWKICSFPLFALLPRRVHHLYFFEVLVANSLVWGAALAWGVRASISPWRRGRKRLGVASGIARPSFPVRTGTDRLAELKRLHDEELITDEEYQRKRAAILTEI